MSRIAVAISVFEDAFSRTLALVIVSLILITVLKQIDTPSLLDIIFPLTTIYITVTILVDSVSTTLVICPLSVIGGTIAPVKESFSLLFVCFP